MDRYARWNALLELLAESGRVSVEDAADRLDVSQATIRRDFDQLAQQQMITRTRGGAVANGVSYDLPLRYKSAKHSAEKQRIGAAAAALVVHGTVVGLNGGTTMTEVARALAVRPDLNISGDGAQLTVVTNALNVAMEVVHADVSGVVVGGELRGRSLELVGPLAEPVAAQINLDIVFAGVDGISAAGGVTTHNPLEARINHVLMERSRRVVVVADHTKLGRATFAQIAPIAIVSQLITDADADEGLLAEIEEAGVEVIRA